MLKKIVLCLSLLILLGLSASYAFLVGKYREFPYQLVSRIETPIIEYIRSIRDDRPADLAEVARQWLDSPYIQTIFLRLKKREIDITPDLPGRGGGLTIANDQLILLTGRGQIYLVDSDHYELSNIRAADNGWEDFVKLGERAGFERYDFQPWHSHRPRYHDILYYPQNRQSNLLISYTEWHPESACYGTTVARLQWPAGTPVGEVNSGPDDWQA